MSVIEYKCPNCGGTLTFDATNQKMSCEFCDSTFDMETFQRYEEAVLNGKEADYDLGNYENSGDHEAWSEEEIQGMKAFSCPSCGGEIIGDETTVATKCPYCDSATVIPGQFSETKRPDFVLPFKKTKAEAEEAFKNNVKGKKLVPAEFLSKQRMESIKGIYVPFWLFDSKISARLTYNCTKVRTWQDSRNKYIETDTYLVERAGDIEFERIPVDGSTKMEDVLMEAIEPFNYSDMVPFTTTYLSGYLADKYDVDADDCKPRAVERIENSTKQMMEDTIMGYNTKTMTNKVMNVNSTSIRYALMPVWLLNTNYEGKIYTFAMNGQTGKFIGELPMCKKKYRKELFKWFLPIAAVISVIACII